MTTVQIKTFLAAAELLSFSGAAQRLFISQSAVSRQIQTMEEELGTTLFQRKGNTIQLTLTGLTLQQGLKKLDTQYDSLVEQIRQQADGSAGQLRFGLMEDQVLDERFLNTLQTLKAEDLQGKRQITLLRMPAESLYGALTEGKLDAACMIFQDNVVPDGLMRQVNSEEMICLAVARLLQFGAVTDPEQFYCRLEALRIPAVMLSDEYFEPSIRAHLNDIRSTQGNLSLVSGIGSLEPMVSAGFAVTFVNESNRLAQDPNIELIPFPFAPPVKKGLLWRADNSNPLFYEFLQQLARSLKK